MTLNPNDILGAAQDALSRAKDAPIGALATQELAPLPSLTENPVAPYTTAPAPAAMPWGDKFPDFPTQLREADGTNLHEVKKHHLAALVEALERTIQAHESFPTPDAAMAVASLSEQVQKLTKDLEKSQDPRVLFDDVIHEVLQPLVTRIVQAVAVEAKWLKQESKGLVIPEKAKPFEEVVHTATQRIGPSLSEGLEYAKTRLTRLLQIKEK